jgi:hypothetical protein
MTDVRAAIATAAHHTLVGPPGVGLQPALGLTQSQQAILENDHSAYVALRVPLLMLRGGVGDGERLARQRRGGFGAWVRRWS